MTEQLIRFYRKFRTLGYPAKDAHRMAQGKVHMFREGIFAAAYFNGERDDFPITLCLVQESPNSGEHGTILNEVGYDSSWANSISKLEDEDGAVLAYEHMILPERG